MAQNLGISPETVPTSRLMVSGRLSIDGALELMELRRGMIVAAAAGEPVGTVAGVLIWQDTEQPTHLLLSCDLASGSYRLLPVEEVAGIENEAVRLRLTASDVATLPRHGPD